MKVVYKNPREKIENNIYRQYYCYTCGGYRVGSNIAYEREIIDERGGTLYICTTCVEDGTAAAEIKKHSKKK